MFGRRSSSGSFKTFFCYSKTSCTACRDAVFGYCSCVVDVRCAVPKQTSRAQLNSMIRDTLQSAADAWGMEVKRYEITEITPDTQISEAMDKQAAAERIRRCFYIFYAVKTCANEVCSWKKFRKFRHSVLGVFFHCCTSKQFRTFWRSVSGVHTAVLRGNLENFKIRHVSGELTAALGSTFRKFRHAFCFRCTHGCSWKQWSVLGSRFWRSTH